MRRGWRHREPPEGSPVSDGAAVAGGRVELQSGATVTGATLPSSFVPEHELGFAVTFPSTNSGDVIVDAGQSRTLAPGAYGQIAVRGTLTLSGGIYYFDALMVDSGAQINFAAGSSPVILYVRRELTSRGTVASGGPPLFIAVAADDHTVAASKSIDIFEAWRGAGLSAELHVYETGGHGFGLGKPGTASAKWTEAFEAWLTGHGIARGESR